MPKFGFAAVISPISVTESVRSVFGILPNFDLTYGFKKLKCAPWELSIAASPRLAMTTGSQVRQGEAESDRYHPRGARSAEYPSGAPVNNT